MKVSAWTWVLIGGIFETAWAITMKYSEGFTEIFYILGLKGEDEAQLELAKRKIERSASRGLKMHPDLLEIVVHGQVSKTEGHKRKYTLKARAITPKETLVASATDWDLRSAFDIISDRLDKRLKQVKRSAKRSTMKPKVREQLIV